MNRLSFLALMLAPLLRPWRALIPMRRFTKTEIVDISTVTLEDIVDIRKGLGKFDGKPIVVSESGVMSIHPSVTGLDDFHKAVDLIHKIAPDGVWVPVGGHYE